MVCKWYQCHWVYIPGTRTNLPTTAECAIHILMPYTKVGKLHYMWLQFFYSNYLGSVRSLNKSWEIKSAVIFFFKFHNDSIEKFVPPKLHLKKTKTWKTWFIFLWGGWEGLWSKFSKMLAFSNFPGLNPLLHNQPKMAINCKSEKAGETTRD